MKKGFLDDYLRPNIILFLKRVNYMEISFDLKKQIDELYDDFEIYDFDLYNYNSKNEFEMTIKRIMDFYYDNIDNVINNYSYERATDFINELKRNMVNFNELIKYLECKL